jgi:hypothetical protein
MSCGQLLVLRRMKRGVTWGVRGQQQQTQKWLNGYAWMHSR